MPKRGTPQRFYVKLDNQQLIKVPTAKWHEWKNQRLLILLGSYVAKPALPGVVWIENGVKHFRPDPVTAWMNLNCRVIERHAIFDVDGPRLEPGELQRRIQYEYREK